MIRVAVILVAFAQMPLVAVAETNSTSPPTKRISDGYYAKRQQAKTASVPANSKPSSDEAEAQPPLDAERAGGPSLTSATAVQPAATGLTPTDPRSTAAYYAQRQAAIPRRPVVSAAQMHYAANMLQQNNVESAPATEMVENSSVQGCVDGCADGCGEDCDGTCDQQCAAGRGPMGLGCMMAAIQAVPTTNVLWNELYSCRKYWVGVDYLGFWVKGNHIPPLVTTSPLGTPQNQAGVLGQPGTSILFGDQRHKHGPAQRRSHHWRGLARRRCAGN